MLLSPRKWQRLPVSMQHHYRTKFQIVKTVKTVQKVKTVPALERPCGTENRHRTCMAKTLKGLVVLYLLPPVTLVSNQHGSLQAEQASHIELSVHELLAHSSVTNNKQMVKAAIVLCQPILRKSIRYALSLLLRYLFVQPCLLSLQHQ